MTTGTVSNAMRRRWDQRVAYLMEFGEDHLDSWEAKFVDSISMQRMEGKDLTGRQAGCLTRIYKKIEEAIG